MKPDQIFIESFLDELRRLEKLSNLKKADGYGEYIQQLFNEAKDATS